MNKLTACPMISSAARAAIIVSKLFLYRLYEYAACHVMYDLMFASSCLDVYYCHSVYYCSTIVVYYHIHYWLHGKCSVFSIVGNIVLGVVEGWIATKTVYAYNVKLNPQQMVGSCHQSQGWAPATNMVRAGFVYSFYGA